MTASFPAPHSLACRCGLGPNHRQRLGVFLAVVLGFAAVEWLVGSQSHSLALQSDAGHMLTDVGAIALALAASWMARLTLVRPRLGQPRLEALAALVNGVGLLAMAGLISLEAWHHLLAPPVAVVSGPMLGTALIGLAVNGLGVWLLHGQGPEASINLRGAFLHVVADLASSLGVILGATCMALFGWFWVDGALSLAIALLIAASALPLVYQSWVLLRAPVDLAALGFLETGRTDLSTQILGKTAD